MLKKIFRSNPVKNLEKLKALQNILKEMGKVLVAFSGGVDSTFLLYQSHIRLKRNVLAVTAVSPIHVKKESDLAKEIAKEIGVEHLLIFTNQMENQNFRMNSKDRCYICKKELFVNLRKIAIKRNIKWIIDGSNLDDTRDLRPGMKAAKEFNVRSPLLEALIDKKEVRLFSKRAGIKIWDKPSLSCLSSRFPYGEEITEEKLKRIYSAEEFLLEKGFINVRVRNYEKLARIEVDEDKIFNFFQNKIRKDVVDYLKKLGYLYVTIDLEGFRSGSMNEIF